MLRGKATVKIRRELPVIEECKSFTPMIDQTTNNNNT